MLMKTILTLTAIMFTVQARDLQVEQHLNTLLGKADQGSSVATESNQEQETYAEGDEVDGREEAGRRELWLMTCEEANKHVQEKHRDK